MPVSNRYCSCFSQGLGYPWLGGSKIWLWSWGSLFFPSFGEYSQWTPACHAREEHWAPCQCSGLSCWRSVLSWLTSWNFRQFGCLCSTEPLHWRIILSGFSRKMPQWWWRKQNPYHGKRGRLDPIHPEVFQDLFWMWTPWPSGSKTNCNSLSLKTRIPY